MSKNSFVFVNFFHILDYLTKRNFEFELGIFVCVDMCCKAHITWIVIFGAFISPRYSEAKAIWFMTLSFSSVTRKAL